ncbi:hypothetical protein KP509_05G031900 [Ceratopteris richardii]|uniref:Uncharacterized protein n=1 Tax=Ceratopteris richardii TaxID=49495 RepID=A0A8T2UPK3_CERRI|nr:hypothetical protein KP509_05G031900 [Ceratopteris richardii]
MRTDEVHQGVQLASSKHISQRCASYLCCCCTPVGKEATSFKVEPVHPTNWQGDAVVAPVVSEAAPPPPPRDAFTEGNAVEAPNNQVTAVKLGPPLRSSLKRPPSRNISTGDSVNGKFEPVKDSEPVCVEKKSITWVDTQGKDLTQVQEFEPR